jgi:hypothetical protein
MIFLLFEPFLSKIGNPLVPPPKTRLKETDPITHDIFIVGYQNGRLGCSISVLRVLSLVYSGKIREKRICSAVIGWCLAFLVVVCLCVAGFFFLPLVWALLLGAIVLTTSVLIFFHRIGDAVLSAALSDDDFYQLVRAAHALEVAADNEGIKPRLHKVVPMRYPRQARRRQRN